MGCLPDMRCRLFFDDLVVGPVAGQSATERGGEDGPAEGFPSTRNQRELTSQVGDAALELAGLPDEIGLLKRVRAGIPHCLRIVWLMFG